MRTHRSTRILLIASLLLTPLAAQGAPKKHLLRYAFQPGKSSFEHTTVTTKLKEKVDGQVTESTMVMETLVERRVTGVQDGKASLEVTMRRLKFTSSEPKVEYDSEVEGSDPGSLKGAAELVGQTVTMKMDDRGRISDLKSPDGKSRVTGMSPGTGSQTPSERQAPSLPDEPIAIGGSWVESTEAGAEPGLVSKTTIQLLGVEGGLARLAFKMDAEDTKLPLGGTVHFVKSEGTWLMELATGMPKESSTEIVVQMDGANAPMKMTTETSVITKSVTIEPPAATSAKKKRGTATGGEKK